MAASLLGAAISATPGAPVSGQTPGSGSDPLSILRERARFVSGYQTLIDVGMAPPALTTRSAARTGLLAMLDLKESSSRFAAAGSGRATSGLATNVGVIANAQSDENEPTVASNPTRPRSLVAGSHSFNPDTGMLHCVASSSSDAGRTWSAPVELPQLGADSFCSDPVLAWAPDGRRVYYAYMDIKSFQSEALPLVTFGDDLDVLVSSSTDGGHTWSAPTIALDGDPFSVTFNVDTGELVSFEPGSDYDKPWIATHPGGHDNRDRVYVSATRFDNLNPAFDCAIVVTTSANAADRWSDPTELDSSGNGFCGGPMVVQGSRPSAGAGSDVVVAWYNSGVDGPGIGSFEIRTATSADRGNHWRKSVTAVTDSFETPSFLGPFAFYHRWNGTMFPDIEIAADGVAHIAYTHDPVENGFTIIDPVFGEIFLPDVSTTAEDGDIRYIHSGRGRYGTGAWTAPVTLNDDGLVRAQGYAALTTAPGPRGGATRVTVIWEDHRLSPEGPTDPAQFEQSSNLYYDIFTTTFDGKHWSPNRRVTDRSSISDFFFVGDYVDITASGESSFSIWTDRRHQTSTGATLNEAGEIVIDASALEDNVFGAANRK